MSLIGARENGGPGDDGRTFDGILPFDRGDITRWNEPYWLRVDEYLRSACTHGNTVFLYPIDGWNVKGAFGNATLEDARRYGSMVATRYRDFPNIMWMTGGDHFPRDTPVPGSSPPEHDAMFEQVLLGMAHVLADVRARLNGVDGSRVFHQLAIGVQCGAAMPV